MSRGMSNLRVPHFSTRRFTAFSSSGVTYSVMASCDRKYRKMKIRFNSRNNSVQLMSNNYITKTIFIELILIKLPFKALKNRTDLGV